VFLFDCFLAALFHHHGCVDVVLDIFCGSLLVHLCLVVVVCYLYSEIKISLFQLLGNPYSGSVLASLYPADF
jgi:hypothetical protein